MNQLEILIEETRKKGLKGQAFGSIIGKINKNKILLQNLKEMTHFLDPIYKEISASQRFYHLWFNMGLENCLCGSPKKFTFNEKFSINQYEKRDANYCGTCGSEKCNKEYNRERGLKKLEEKHGTKNIWEIPGYREKVENSNLKKHGVKYYTESNKFKEQSKQKIEKRTSEEREEINKKREATNIKKYGKKCLLEDKEWKENKMMEKYGVKHNMQLKDHIDKHKMIMEERHGGILHQSDKIKEKIEKTNIIKYGSKFPIQNSEVFETQYKNTRKFKNYTLPSGKIIKIQGYEGLALDILLKEYNENNIIIDKRQIAEECGNFYYNNGLNKYYPDFYIRSINTIIEVKSEYTYNYDIQKNYLKKDSVLKNRINFIFMIFDNRGKFLRHE
jgi:hypothetical protein